MEANAGTVLLAQPARARLGGGDTPRSCRRGHPLEGENLLVLRSGRAWCRVCNRLRARRARALRAGRPDPHPEFVRLKTPDWTPAEDQRLRELLADHCSYAEAARALGRSAEAVEKRAQMLGCRLLRAYGESLPAVARRLGVSASTVRSWVQKGWLRAVPSGANRRRGSPRLVEPVDLDRFLQDERYWHLWEPSWIADPELRAWGTELRGRVRFLTLSEAAAALYLTPGGAAKAVQEGRLQAAKRGRSWVVRSDRLALAPERPRRRGPRLRPGELETVRRLWGRVPATTIARRLGRSDSGVHTAARRLGLPRLGRGSWTVRRAAGSRRGG